MVQLDILVWDDEFDVKKYEKNLVDFFSLKVKKYSSDFRNFVTISHYYGLD